MPVRTGAKGHALVMGGPVATLPPSRPLPHSLLRTGLLVGVAYGALIGAALAQEPAADPDCSDPTSCAVAATPTPHVLDPILVISRTDETPIDSMESVSRIGPEDLSRRMPTTANDVFFGTPGVAIQTDARRAGSAANIRGLQDFGRVQVIVDGARQNFNRSGHGTSAMFFVDPNLLESVEVVRGPVANTYGSGAIGGVMMFNTRRADSFLAADERTALQTSLSYDTNAQGVTASAIGAARLTDQASIIGNVAWRDFKDYTDGHGDTVSGSSFDVVSGLIKATLAPTEIVTLDLGWNGNRDQWEESGGTSEIQVQQNTYTAQFELNDPDNRWIDLHVNASVNTVDLNSRTRVDRSQFSSETGLPITIPAGSETTYDLTTTAVDAWNTTRFNTGPISHEVTYGGDWVRDDITTRSPAGGADVYTPSGERTVWGLYLQTKMTFDWLQLIGAVRYDRYELTGTNVSSSGDRVSPRFTVGVTPFEQGPLSGLQIYGTYAEGYRSPSITETVMSGLHPSGVVFPFLPNPTLEPETARTVEVGINYGYDDLVDPGDSLRIKAAYFDNAISNYIGLRTLSPFVPGSGCTFVPGPSRIPVCYQYDNFASASISGFELEAHYDRPGWFAGVNASIIDGHTEEAGVITPLITVPTTQITGEAGIRLFDGRLTLGGEVQHNWAPRAVTMDDYTLTNLFASYQLLDNVALTGRVDNVFDVRYANPLNVSTTSTVYEPGISARLGVSIRW